MNGQRLMNGQEHNIAIQPESGTGKVAEARRRQANLGMCWSGTGTE